MTHTGHGCASVFAPSDFLVSPADFSSAHTAAAAKRSERTSVAASIRYRRMTGPPFLESGTAAESKPVSEAFPKPIKTLSFRSVYATIYIGRK
jgi:hypothetical protein